MSEPIQTETESFRRPASTPGRVSVSVPACGSTTDWDSTGASLSTSAPVAKRLYNVEKHLEHLLKELHEVHRFKSKASGPWEKNITTFRIKTTTIRRILDRFHNVDLPTRRYLCEHLDSEFAELKTAFHELRAEFIGQQPHQAGGKSCSGLLSSPSERSSEQSQTHSGTRSQHEFNCLDFSV
jgi:hypothetical protein